MFNSSIAKSSVEFALHHQHETSHDSETQTEEDLKQVSKAAWRLVNGFME